MPRSLSLGFSCYEVEKPRFDFLDESPFGDIVLLNISDSLLAALAMPTIAATTPLINSLAFSSKPKQSTI